MPEMNWLKSKWFVVGATIFVVGIIMSQTISTPTFSGISKFEIVDFSNGKMKANVLLKVQNDNWFSFTGEKLQFKMYYKNHLIAEGKGIESFQLEKKSESLIPVVADFYADSLLNDLKTILYQDSIQLKVVVQGEFTFFKINTSTTLDTWLNTKDIMDAVITNSMGEDGLNVESIKLKEFTIPTTFFDISFNFKNKLPFDILVKEIRGSIFAEKELKTKVSDWAFPAEKLLKINDSALIEGTSNVNNLTSALSGFSKVLTGSLDYYLHGDALISIDGREIKIPLRQHFKVNIHTKEIEIIK